jgi:AcrR family transcriptional regulator
MGQLDRDQIAARGLAVLDQYGLAGFTIRAVAEALGVTPMALYHHVANKAELAALVVNAAHNSPPLDTPVGVWQEDLWAIARWTRDTINNHTAVSELRRIYRIYTPEIVLVAERWLSVWQQSGLPLAKALVAARVSSLTIAGLVMEEAHIRDVDKPERALLARLPGARLMYETEQDPKSAFELAVRSLIDGLPARLTCESKSIARRSRQKKTKVHRAKR